jgi:hypothetical protein
MAPNSAAERRVQPALEADMHERGVALKAVTGQVT